MIAGWRASSRQGLGQAIAIGLLACLIGCQEGRAPYPVIEPGGGPGEFIPPGGVPVGTTRTDGLIYKFDFRTFQLFTPLPGTEPRFVFRDSVLALRAAGNPGAPGSLRLRPDLSDPTLAAVYADPRLFGFQPADPSAVGFVTGRSTTSAAEFLPTQIGNRWDMNHKSRAWAVVDSIIGPSSAPTGGTMPVVRSLSMSRSRPDLRLAYIPAAFDANTDFTAAPGIGIYYHAWDLVAERVVPRDRQSQDAPQPRDRQSNPRFLWLPVAATFDPNAPYSVGIDHCLDGLPSYLEFHPLKVTDDTIQEGAKYSTWTYLTVDTAVLRQRLNSEAQQPRGGRCGFDIPVGMDTLRLLPTRTFRMLMRFDVAVERVVNQVLVQPSDAVLGRYPRTAAENSVVKFRIQMFINDGRSEGAVQQIDLWLQRGIGPVIREIGLFGATRASARLRSAVIDGIVYPPDNPAFQYFDEM